MKSPSTDRTTKAAVYRKAALAVERRREDFACNAIFRVVRGRSRMYTGRWMTERDTLPDVQAFTALFAPKGHKPLLPWFGEYWDAERRAERIVALCFMAAMVEAGDA